MRKTKPEQKQHCGQKKKRKKERQKEREREREREREKGDRSNFNCIGQRTNKLVSHKT